MLYFDKTTNQPVTVSVQSLTLHFKKVIDGNTEIRIYHPHAINVQYFLFSALTLLVGRQEGHPASETTGCWFVGGDDLTGALHDL